MRCEVGKWSEGADRLSAPSLWGIRGGLRPRCGDAAAREPRVVKRLSFGGDGNHGTVAGEVDGNGVETFVARDVVAVESRVFYGCTIIAVPGMVDDNLPDAGKFNIAAPDEKRSVGGKFYR